MDDLYTYIDPHTQEPKRMSFTNMDQVVKACARHEHLPGDEPGREGTVDVLVVLGEDGQATDGQFLPSLALNHRCFCRWQNLGFTVKTRPSRECDIATLERQPSLPLKDSGRDLDLRNLFPGVPVEECERRMRVRQAELLHEARPMMRDNNLIVVGSPGVNQVMRHLCDRLITSGVPLGDQGMYVYPATGRAPLAVRLSRQANGTGRHWMEFRERHWAHRDIGWVHMMRNPWSLPERPRFLIYYGGFYPQGVQAAMRKRQQISDALVRESANLRSDRADAVRAYLREASHPNECLDFRFREGEGEDCFIPAHIVRAKYEYSITGLSETLPPDERTRLWTHTNPSFLGTVPCFEAVTSPID